MNEKNIWHVGAWNRNFGDHVLQASIRENLKRINDVPLNFTPVDCQNTYFFPKLIKKLNREADLLIVGGGGLVFHRPQDKSLSGWQFNIKIEDLKKIEVPLVIYGIGYNQFYYDNRGFKSILNSHLLETQRVSSLFSVRDEGTKRELIRRNLDKEKITIIPDPAMFLKPSKIEIPKIDNNRLKIGINWVSDRPQFTFPKPYKKIQKKVVDNFTKAFKYLIEEKNGQIIFIEHIQNLDKPITSYMKKKLKENFISIEENLSIIFPPSLVYAPFLVDIYRQMDLIIGMRGHSNIIPFGTNTPFIALGSHNKNRYFLEQIDEEKYLFDIRKYEIECSPDNIIRKIESLLEEREKYLERTSKKREYLKNKLNKFNRDIIKLIEQ